MNTLSTKLLLPPALDLNVTARIQTGWTAAQQVGLLWLDRARHRAALRKLSDQQLRAVGLDVETIRADVNKPFWKA